MKCLGSALKNPQNLAEALSQCCGCRGSHLHSSCASNSTKAKVSINLATFVDGGNKWFCSECRVCAACNSEKEPFVVACTDCRKSYHLSCNSSSIDKKSKALWR
jgi:hypothetical protein